MCGEHFTSEGEEGAQQKTMLHGLWTKWGLTDEELLIHVEIFFAILHYRSGPSLKLTAFKDVRFAPGLVAEMEKKQME